MREEMLSNPRLYFPTVVDGHREDKRQMEDEKSESKIKKTSYMKQSRALTSGRTRSQREHETDSTMVDTVAPLATDPYYITVFSD